MHEGHGNSRVGKQSKHVEWKMGPKTVSFNINANPNRFQCDRIANGLSARQGCIC